MKSANTAVVVALISAGLTSCSPGGDSVIQGWRDQQHWLCVSVFLVVDDTSGQPVPAVVSKVALTDTKGTPLQSTIVTMSPPNGGLGVHEDSNPRATIQVEHEVGKLLVRVRTVEKAQATVTLQADGYAPVEVNLDPIAGAEPATDSLPPKTVRLRKPRSEATKPPSREESEPER